MLIGLVAAAVLAYLGALGTGAAPLVQRLAYWLAVILPGSLLGLVLHPLVSGWGRLRRHRGAEILLVALLVSLPHSFIVIVTSALFFGVDAITPPLVLQFWVAVLVIALVLTAINHLAAAPGSDMPAVAAEAVAGPPPSPPAARSPDADPNALPAIPPMLAEKLPARLRAAGLIAIEAEDHYLRIHTDRGSDLVLMRMIDACALLDGASGARVHRSWWVARAAVEGRTRQGGRVELALTAGLRAPVSRAMQAAVRAPDWEGRGARDQGPG